MITFSHLHYKNYDILKTQTYNIQNFKVNIYTMNNDYII